MKVISIKEPFATLIMNGDKKIETRSWKTNYRGELFIHASGKNLAKEFLNNDYVVNLIDGLEMNYGNIICRGNLVDCIYMDETFLNAIKEEEKEYNLGLYEIGRYAWIFEDVEPICPIPAKGQLNIWNYDGEYEIMNNKKHR
ncbi:MAG: ASCH domain-containing protein [Bacilli bacterium]|nr:ASCH domain-containing protein [Bacilli bacterium]MDY5058378.1 ASCH domain-containing protein [Bacilli bacterium]MDY5996780.1 ASCH domain-containing protein [Bacilli bacterium]